MLPIYKFFELEQQAQISPINSLELVKENLDDPNSRNLMVISDDFESSISLLQNIFLTQKKQSRIFYGSDFKNDSSEESAYQQIKDIITCMEEGIVCILLNLNNIY